MKIGLIGQTNVGKSTLFNQLLGTFRAIVTDIPGTTRDIIEEPASLDGVAVTLLDSPGLDSFDLEKVYIANIIESADILLFVVDGK
ncbi:MAG: 50S ribosome-binding GTPase [Candidatus Peribacteria bacterium]|nr:MAG: 50S ribosome-binding GTPase [Candidatus Peribacteria bacterium]